jgi:WD40 repeat protein
VKVWDVESQKPLDGVTGPPDYAKAVAFSPDGRSVASAGMIIRVWNLDQRQKTAEFTGHGGPVRSLAFSPDGTLLASGAEDNVVGIWKLSKPQQ